MSALSSVLFFAALLPAQTEVFRDFRTGAALPSDLLLIGPAAEDVVKPQAGGLRLTLPTEGRQTRGWGVATSALAGDFEVTATYELLAVETPERGGGAGVALNVWVPGAEAQKFAKVGHFKRVGGAEIYPVEVAIKGMPGSFVEEPVAPGTRSGQLRVVRKGSILSLQIARQPGGAFHALHEADFGAEDMAVRFIANNNSSPTVVDARLLDLKVRTGSAAPPPVQAAPVPAAEEAEPRTRPGRLLTLLALVTVLVVGGGYYVWRRRGQPAREYSPVAREGDDA